MAELMEMLRKREVDFALAFKPNVPVEDVVSHPLFQNYIAVIVGDMHPLAKNSKVTLDELSRYELALPAKGLQARNTFDRILEHYHHERFSIRLELNEVNILLSLIRQNRLATVLAEATIHNERGVKAIPMDVPGNEMEGCVHTLNDSYIKRSMREFIRMLSDSVAVRERVNAWL